MADDVVLEGDVLGHLPRAGRVVLIELEENRRAVLCRVPVVLEDVAFDIDIAADFQLEQVLHIPHAHPRGRLIEIVALDRDVRGNGVRDVAARAAEENVFTPGLEKVIGDVVRTRTVRAADGLAVAAVLVNLFDVTVGDIGGAAVERDGATDLPCWCSDENSSGR